MSDLPRKLDPVAALFGRTAHDELLDATISGRSRSASRVSALASRVRTRVVATLEQERRVQRACTTQSERDELDDALRDLHDELSDAFAEVASAIGDLATWYTDAESARVRAEAERDEHESTLDTALERLDDDVEAALVQAQRTLALVQEGVSPGWLADNYEVDVERAARDMIDAVAAIRRSVS